jgi:hypothetical protein
MSMGSHDFRDTKESLDQVLHTIWSIDGLSRIISSLFRHRFRTKWRDSGYRSRTGSGPQKEERNTSFTQDGGGSEWQRWDQRACEVDGVLRTKSPGAHHPH